MKTYTKPTLVKRDRLSTVTATHISPFDHHAPPPPPPEPAE